MQNNLIKTRIEESANYRAIWCNGKTLRFAIDPKKPITELKYPEFYDIKVTGNCEGKCQYCLTPDITISTPNGEVPIVDIVANDQVFSINEENNMVEIQPVSQLYSREYDDDLIEITLENGQAIKVTPNHKMFVIGKGWIPAGEITEEDELFDINVE